MGLSYSAWRSADKTCSSENFDRFMDPLLSTGPPNLVYFYQQPSLYRKTPAHEKQAGIVSLDYPLT